MMSLLVLLGLLSVASAHFQLQFPLPRGPFDMNNEPTFCDGFTQAVNNRSTFPLGETFFSLNSEHPQWTLAVYISTDQDPDTFQDFNVTSSGEQLPMAKPFFHASGEGLACFPIDIGALGISGVQAGSNVSLEFEFNGGDGQLWQCADLTLSDDFTPSASCANGTHTSSIPGPTSTSPTSSGSSSSVSSTQSTTHSQSPSSAASVKFGRGVLLSIITVVLGLVGTAVLISF